MLPEGDDIWIKLPNIPGNPSLSGKIVRLIKSLYGLRQAPKLWYKYLYQRLKKLGFCRSSSSDSLFLLRSTDPVFILAYVDDILIIGSRKAVSIVVRQLEKEFTVTNLGKCSHYLGVKFEKRPDGIFMSQSSYIKRIIESAHMTTAKPSKHPLPMSHPLYDELIELTDKEEEEMKNIPFRKALGALLFLSTRTRPDITTAVSMLAKYQSKPSMQHWKMAKNVVRYLIDTQDRGILMQNNDEGLICWVDADWARDLSKRRSRTGILITYNGAPIVWVSKLQTTTAQSTAEAEFNALAHGIKEVKWMRSILNEIGMPQTEPTTVYQDNLGSISWTEDVQGIRRVKHVGTKYHFVRDNIESKGVVVKYTPSHLNRSDSLTKVLISEDYSRHRS